MKSFAVLILAFILVPCSTMYGQWQAGPKGSLFYVGGNVGLATSSPSMTLDVGGDVNFNGTIFWPHDQFGHTQMAITGYTRTKILSTSWDQSLGDYLDLEVPGNDGPPNRIRITSHGNVGINNSSPAHTLDVNGTIQANNASGSAISGSTLSGYAVVGQASGAGWGGLFEYGSDGNNSAYLGAKDNAAEFYGPITVNGIASVHELTITGGNDLSEPFNISSTDIPAGAIMIIDDEHPGKLKLSEHAYDTRVAGILSGAMGIKPGISMHQEGLADGGRNVALSGRVYALADASNGPIRPGDLLTTSKIPGSCMRVTDHAKAFGAIIGKAMSSLEQAKGMVLVLVCLQ